jgi:flagellar biosynthesis/type III secretory pathway protein FliH
MNSSEFLRRPELADLRESDAAPTPRLFEERTEFERLERRPVREISPEQAFKNGLAEGESIGREAALKELAPVADELRAVASSMAQVREQRLEELETELLRIATEIARHILRGELQQPGDVVVRLAHTCICEARDEGSAVLRHHPGDLELIRVHLSELEAELTEAAIRTEPDPAIERGCVVVETPNRCYEGRPERILDAALEQLAGTTVEEQ